MDIHNPKGLHIELLESGAVKSIISGKIRVSLRESTPFSGPGANVFLRKHSGIIQYIPLTGPQSTGSFCVEQNQLISRGNWEGVEYECSLQLSERSHSWQWSITLTGKSDQESKYDLICVQDLGLKPSDAGMVNEYYVSQYTERLMLNDQILGPVICCRQNMKETTGHPWLMMACKGGAASGTTDGMPFYGMSSREHGIPEGLQKETLDGEYAGESSVIALQAKPFTLKNGQTHWEAFVFTFLENHPEATTEDDLKKLPGLLKEFADNPAGIASGKWEKPVTNLFHTAPFLPTDDLNSSELEIFFGNQRRHEETEKGQLLSFFCNEHDHVVLKAKELLTYRPHGHIMQANTGLTPNEGIMSTNPYAFGVFNSHLTQGNTNFNIFLSVCSGQFNFVKETGQRIFVKSGNQTWLLGVPSAFEMGLNHCRWIYKHNDLILQVRTWTNPDAPHIHTDVIVLSGDNVDLIITHQFDPLNEWKITGGETRREFIARPADKSMIKDKFPAAQFRMMVHTHEISTHGAEVLQNVSGSKPDNSLFVIKAENCSTFSMSFVGEVTAPVENSLMDSPDEQFLLQCEKAAHHWKTLGQNLSMKGNHPDINAIGEILPWYGLNALIHYLTPYGLEQFGGAAWGTRDVSQGPVDLLLYTGKYKEAREVICTIFSHQNTDGGWPQWWMFDSYNHIRANEAHGDIQYWCIIALTQYIQVTGDAGILDEELPWFGENQEKKTPLSEHLDRLIRMIVDSFIPGTSLVPFGGGDWNDSLQPVSEELAQRMISSWTVEMNYQAFQQLQQVYLLKGDQDKTREMENICSQIKSDFNQHLVKEDVVAGYGLVEKDGSISVMLHPSDNSTGIKYSVLPMNRGIISGIFTPEQAEKHQLLVENYLKGPDGVRLMDRPLPYKGGIQEIFQRAESSTFFGREIGLMYVHEHIRYAESLAIMGKPEAFIKAMRQAIPVDYRKVVSCGDIRQANCYYSSSDVVFKNRYDADEKYTDVLEGKMTVRGGWRVYSSGPGIYNGLVTTRLLGLRVYATHIVIDPVMPVGFDGLEASTRLWDYPIRLVYKTGKKGFGVKSMTLNGQSLTSEQEENPYREGGLVIDKKQVIVLLRKDDNILEIEIK